MFYDGWDGLRGCDICGNDTTGRLCTSCAQQEMIDNDDVADMFPEDGTPPGWYDEGGEYGDGDRWDDDPEDGEDV